MEKLLLIGINTRVLLDSASKLKNYKIYSVSYFYTVDFKKPSNEKHVLEQVPGKSCGFFEEKYNPEELLELALEYMEEADKIVLTTGISPSDFKGKYKKYKKKIVGNQNTADVEDKYKFYKKIKNDFLVPKTFKLKYGYSNSYDIGELVEILKQYDDKSFIVKPLEGSGGYGVQHLKYNKEHHQLNNSYFENYFKKHFSYYKEQDFLIQEFIPGNNISSSVLATKDQTKSIINSKILIESDFGEENNFKYSGNIVPYNHNIINNKSNITDLLSIDNRINNRTYNNIDNKIANGINNSIANGIGNEIINDIAEEIVSKFRLIGSNGVDMITKYDKSMNNEENVYIVEINPRFQGTYECVEKVLGINLLEAHIKACEGELIKVPKAKCYSMKRIIYTKERLKVGNLSIDNVYDIPYEGVIIEKDQPLSTIISCGNSIKDAENKTKKVISNINRSRSILTNYINN